MFLPVSPLHREHNARSEASVGVVRCYPRLHRSWVWLIRLILLLICGLAPAVSAGENAAAPASLVVAMDDNYPPYVFRDSDGQLKGYLVDQWRLWQQKTGIPVDIRATDWATAQVNMDKGAAQVIDTVFETPARKQKYDFTPAYADIPVSIYAQSDLSGITDLKTLSAYVVAAKAGDACIDRLHQGGISAIETYDSYQRLVDAAVAGRVKVFCLDEPPANHLLSRANADQHFRKAFALYSGQFHRAVHKGDSTTLNLVRRGFDAMSAGELQALQDKWMGTPLPSGINLRYIGYGVLGLILIGVLLLVWTMMLKRQIRQHTTLLSLERTQLRTLLHTIPDCVWLKDPDGVFLACNPAFERLYGMAEQDIIGKTDYDFLPQETADVFKSHDQEAIAASRSQGHESWIAQAQDRDQILIETTKTPMYGADGSLIGVLGVARDITERHRAREETQRLLVAAEESRRVLMAVVEEQKSAEAALRESEFLFRSQFDLGNIGIAITSPQRLWLRVNPYLCAMLGYDADEFALKTWSDITHPDDLAADLVLFGQLLLGEIDRYELDKRYLRKDGQVVYSHVSVACYREGGGVKFVINSILDITIRKAAEEQLRRVNNAYATLSRTNQAIVQMQNIDALFHRVCLIAIEHGDYMGAWIGLPDPGNEQIIPRYLAGSTTDYARQLRIGTSESTAEGRGPAGQALRSGKPYYCQDFLLDPNTEPWHEAACRFNIRASVALPLLRAGQPYAVLTLYSHEPDVFDEKMRALLEEMAANLSFAIDNLDREAARKSAEVALAQEANRQRILFEQAHDGVIVLDDEFTVVEANASFAAMLGTTPDTVLTLHPWDWDVSLCTPRKLRAFWPQLPNSSGSFETTIRRVDGSTFIAQLSYNPAWWGDHHFLFMTCRDISNLKRIENEVRELNEQLEQRVRERTAELESANHDLESFSYSVSHDLRAPLRAISGFAQILARRHRENLDEEGRHYLDNVVAASARMGALIDDLLAYCRTGRSALRIHPVQLSPLIRQITDTFADRIAECGGRLEVVEPLATPLGDATLINQILSNLVDNAIMYRQSETPLAITLSAQRQNGQVLMSVADNGIGISAEYHEKIFQVFQRLHKEHDYPGTGIGLAIVAKAVRMLEGQVTVDSEPGKGSTFTVQLPAAF